jgi:hypothetical protein
MEVPEEVKGLEVESAPAVATELAQAREAARAHEVGSRHEGVLPPAVPAMVEAPELPFVL